MASIIIGAIAGSHSLYTLYKAKREKKRQRKQALEKSVRTSTGGSSRTEATTPRHGSDESQRPRVDFDDGAAQEERAGRLSEASTLAGDGSSYRLRSEESTRRVAARGMSEE